MKKVWLWLVVITLFISLGLSSSFAAKKQYRFVFVSPLVANAYWDVVEAGVKDAAKDYNVNVQYVGTTSLDLNEWMKYIETAISQRVDGIATMALNADAIKPLIDRAKANKIPVVLVDTDAPKSARVSYAGTNNFEAGKTLGQALAKLTNGTAKIGMMTGALDQPNLNQRMDGFKEGIKAYPGLQIVALDGDNSDLQLCIQKAEAMLRAHPEITALVGFEGFGVPGLGRVVKETNNVGKITVAGFDDLADTIAFIKDGTAQATVVQRQYKMGYMSVQILNDIKRGKKVESIYDTGTVVLTKDNVGTYKANSK